VEVQPTKAPRGDETDSGEGPCPQKRVLNIKTKTKYSRLKIYFSLKLGFGPGHR